MENSRPPILALALAKLPAWDPSCCGGLPSAIELAAGLPDDADVCCNEASFAVNPRCIRDLYLETEAYLATRKDQEIPAASTAREVAEHLATDRRSACLQLLLICAPMRYSAWNSRKLLLEDALLAPTLAAPTLAAQLFAAEQSFVTAVQGISRSHAKWGELWEHRRWLVNEAVKRAASSAAGVCGGDADDWVVIALVVLLREAEAAAVGATRYNRNYHAWKHRLQCLRQLLQLLSVTASACSPDLDPAGVLVVGQINKYPEIAGAVLINELGGGGTAAGQFEIETSSCSGAHSICCVDSRGALSLVCRDLALTALLRLPTSPSPPAPSLIALAKVLRDDMSLVHHRLQLLQFAVELAHVDTGLVLLLCEVLILLPPTLLTTMIRVAPASPGGGTVVEGAEPLAKITRIPFTASYGLLGWARCLEQFTSKRCRCAMNNGANAAACTAVCCCVFLRELATGARDLSVVLRSRHSRFVAQTAAGEGLCSPKRLCDPGDGAPRALAQALFLGSSTPLRLVSDASLGGGEGSATAVLEEVERARDCLRRAQASASSESPLSLLPGCTAHETTALGVITGVAAAFGGAQPRAPNAVLLRAYAQSVL